MDRRKFIRNSVLGAGAVALTGGGIWFGRQAAKERLTLDAALNQLDRFAHNGAISQGAWNAAQVFTHCAQSIEYSIAGYPEHKSELFKQTVGPVAFGLFAARGKMRHDLGEPIPGAPLLDPQQDAQQALARLHQALVEFDRHSGPFAPHFAYGDMTKEDYRLAHLMHLNNHFEELELAFVDV